MFTSRSTTGRFFGQVRGTLYYNTPTQQWFLDPLTNPQQIHTIESHLAEIIWWADRDDLGNYQLYRRTIADPARHRD